MHEEQKEILHQKIYQTICYACDIEPSEFSPDILINYGEYEQQGECVDDLTYDHIPEALGMISSYELPFANNVYFRDSVNPVTLIMDLFKPKKETRPPLIAKQYADLIIPLYEEYLAEKLQKEKRIATLIDEIPQDKKEHFQKKLYLLLMRTLSIEEKDFSPDTIINKGVYKLSGRKAERFILQSALCLQLSSYKVYSHFQERKYFDLPMSIIGWILIILLSPVFVFAFTIISIISFIHLILNRFTFIKTGRWTKPASQVIVKPKKNAKDINPFNSSSNS